MARNIFIVNATQVVVSQAHPEGLFSVVTGYPKNFDSESYADTDAALRAAKSEYFSRLSANYAANNRAMTTVTLEQADGRQIMRESEGTFPVEEPEEVAEPEGEGA